MKIVEETTNLEDLIILGEDKKVPISIEFPSGEKKIKAKALIKPLTLGEIDDIQINQDNLLKAQMEMLKNNLFKTDGSNFSEKELESFPIGVIKNITERIMEISGIDYKPDDLKDF